MEKGKFVRIPQNSGYNVRLNSFVIDLEFNLPESACDDGPVHLFTMEGSYASFLISVFYDN